MYYCKECGNEYKKWYGRCPSCKEYNTLVEVDEVKMFQGDKKINIDIKDIKVEKLNEVKEQSKERHYTDIDELDLVLGGGLVKGSLVLLGGSPGVGKSTLTMQLAINVSVNNNLLYVSGEESVDQVKLRADRITDKIPDNFLIANIKNLEQIFKVALERKVQFLIIDSIQTIYSGNNTTLSGSITQLKECTLKSMYFAKENNITVIIIGHVTKEGEIAGPKILEHMVDVVLYLESEKNTDLKILRSQKNRFGKSGEIGLLEMKENGLESIDIIMRNTSGIDKIEGLTFGMVNEGNRIFCIEVQTLIVPTIFGYPKRITQGYDIQRLNLLLGLLYKRLRLDFNNVDCYLNTSLNFKYKNNALDLAVIASLISLKLNKKLEKNVVFLGEVSLTGEIKRVSKQEEKIMEAKKLGFKVVYCNLDLKKEKIEGIKIIDIKHVESLKIK